ncbi:MAG: MFS transporter [Candidatus Latescibacterota bacterium]|nr:MFS transporter [Candidatus Latescibacterota bacterium]MEC9379859.1 MFS transporter [Candidatus Latescibacterota bacterium]MED5413352.1 MFS transporter [Candidatus Latescibacterota bacterium]MEE3040289.1 MFS transporter [Candidatus Latescibacterota bacterium]MEE3265037.1 MFS transporter [Candidatus Latescibacterota bacterium]
MSDAPTSAPGESVTDGRMKVLFVLSLAELLGMALWFSATAVVPALTQEWQLTDSGRSWLTMSVQIGFVVGTLLSALANLPDIVNSRRLFTICALLGALCNASIGWWVNAIEPAIVLRFLTGVCLAGVYPPGMKIMATWFREGRGMAIGMLVGALTIGSASPHLLHALAGEADWRQLMFLASASAVGAAILCALFVSDGPYATGGARFDWRAAGRAFGDRAVRLANFGYLGHQWELYAMWTWIPMFLRASIEISDPSLVPWTGVAAFSVIAVGGIGCVMAGMIADRVGRTRVTIVSMAVSGTCCLLAGPLFGGPPILLLALCLVWGFAIVADSAQFSASITELCDPQYVGTALTLQTCLGFLLTLASIRIVPWLVGPFGWEMVFAFLAIGPVFGIISMARLRRLPEAAKIGGETFIDRSSAS